MDIYIGITSLVVTAIYAFLTYRIARSNEQTVAEMKTQTDSLLRPYITITHNFSSQTLVRLSIKNTGKSNAENMRLQLDKDFHIFGRKDSNIASVYLFQNVIESFPPDAQLYFPLISSLELQNNKIINPLSPTVFTITATYSYSGKTFVENTVIDLRLYQGIWMPPETIEEKASELTKEIKELSNIVAKSLLPNQSLKMTLRPQPRKSKRS